MRKKKRLRWLKRAFAALVLVFLTAMSAATVLNQIGRAHV